MKRIHALAALPLAALLALGSGTVLAQSDPATSVRDWSKIDTNRDNLISPEEMKAYLEAEWRAAKR